MKYALFIWLLSCCWLGTSAAGMIDGRVAFEGMPVPDAQIVVVPVAADGQPDEQDALFVTPDTAGRFEFESPSDHFFLIAISGDLLTGRRSDEIGSVPVLLDFATDQSAILPAAVECECNRVIWNLYYKCCHDTSRPWHWWCFYSWGCN